MFNAYRAVILPADEDTIHSYAAIAAELTVNGVPMQQNDIWIAALARQFGRTLAMRDHDFERVSGLSVEFW